jgi:uncharacterized membrane-anchored protein
VGRLVGHARGGEVRRAYRRHVSGTLAGGLAFTWERHSEASTQTVFAPGADTATPELGAALAWMASLPGATVRATRLVIVADDAAAQQAMARRPGLAAGFRARRHGLVPRGRANAHLV